MQDDDETQLQLARFLCAPLLTPSSFLFLFHSPPLLILLMFHTPPQTLQSVLRKLLEHPRQYVADVCFEYPQGKIYAHRGMKWDSHGIGHCFY